MIFKIIIFVKFFYVKINLNWIYKNFYFIILNTSINVLDC